MSIKVLMYGWEFPPHISGGLGVACYAIVKELAKKNVELTLVLPQVVDIDNIDNVRIFNCDAKTMEPKFAGIVNIKHPAVVTHLFPYAKTKDFNGLVSNEALQEFLSLLSQLDLPVDIKDMVGEIVEDQRDMIGRASIINLLTEVFRYALFAGDLYKEVDCDLIHAHDWLTVLAALEAKRHLHKPLLFHIHSLETDRGGLWANKLIFAIEKYGMELADQIIAVSQYTKDNIVRHYGIAPEKITVVHNGIYYDRSSFPTKSGKKSGDPEMVLFLGRITRQKGPYFFIEVAKKILEKKPNLQFVLAGTGDLLVDMIEHVASLKIGKNVHFTGFLDSEQVKKIYQLADVYVMPSVSEPFGLSALEALSYNVPIVMSKQSGAKEVLSHVLVADFWDIEDMTAKILALLEYPMLSKASLAHTSDDLQVTTWSGAAEKIINR